jgi:glycosyltransferase involved in cell wall biosynthesis
MKRGSWADKFVFVAPSRWMAALKAKSALLPDASVVVVPNPVPIDTFREAESGWARRTLGLPLDRPIVGFVADEGASNPLKGFRHLIEAMRSVQVLHPQVQLLIVGKPPADSCELGIRFLTTGQIRDDGRLAAAYAACDLVCVPSLLDNAPQTVTEASAVGRPIAGYASGGIPEFVEDGVTGRLVSPGDVKGLAEVISRLIEIPHDAQRMGRAGRQRAIEEWNPKVVGFRYHTVYQQALEHASLR